MPKRDSARYEGGFHASPECWEVFTEVLGKEFSNAVLFGQVHQLTVDEYAAQHAGGRHRDKSVVIHLCGLHLVLDRELRPTEVPPLFQRIAGVVKTWPHLSPPNGLSAMTVFDVALAESPQDHARIVRDWANFVWRKWSEQHALIRSFVDAHLDFKERGEHGQHTE